MSTGKNNKAIQILRGSSSYDTSTSTDVLLDGQPFYSKKTKQLYVGDKNSNPNLWIKDQLPVGAAHLSPGKNNNCSIRQLSAATEDGSYAVGTRSVALNNDTRASGQDALAIGNQTIASGNGSFAQGQGTIASGNNQTVVGEYNAVSTDALFVVGNGSQSSKSNALSVNKNGNTTIQKQLSAGGGATINGGSTVINDSGTSNHIKLQHNGNDVIKIDNSGLTIDDKGSNNSISIKHNGTEKIKISSSGVEIHDAQISGKVSGEEADDSILGSHRDIWFSDSNTTNSEYSKRCYDTDFYYDANDKKIHVNNVEGNIFGERDNVTDKESEIWFSHGETQGLDYSKRGWSNYFTYNPSTKTLNATNITCDTITCSNMVGSTVGNTGSEVLGYLNGSISGEEGKNDADRDVWFSDSTTINSQYAKRNYSSLLTYNPNTKTLKTTNMSVTSVSASSVSANTVKSTTQPSKDSSSDLCLRFADILNILYPVGSIYLTTSSTFDPNNAFGGKWGKIKSGYALWTTAGSDAGKTISAGLPNIAGSIYSSVYGADNGATAFSSANGCFEGKSNDDLVTGNNNNPGGGYREVAFTASKGETKIDGTAKTDADYKVYGKSDTVQPPAYKVYAWERIS